MKALILGAGYGVRLYPLTKNTPKPLLQIGHKPVIEWTLSQIMALKEMKEVFIVVNQRFYEHYQRWLDNYQSVSADSSGRPFPKITLCNDQTLTNEDRLGAIGDIALAIQRFEIKDDLLVVAGDNLFEFNLSALVKTFKAKGTTIALKNMKDIDKRLISQYSVVTLDKENRLIDFEEKPPVPKSTLVAICLYIFGASTLGLINEYLRSGFNPDAPGYYIQWLYKKINVYGCAMKGPWFDIGDIDSYNKANDYYLRRPGKKQKTGSRSKPMMLYSC
ncbi:MAG: nucleotidyltransferase family protein [Planctomycetota bacterium]